MAADESENGDSPTANQRGADRTPSTPTLRNSIARWFGDSIYDERQYYDVFDWPSIEGIPEEQYLATYLRNPFAKPVVDRPAMTAWRDDPQLVDGDADEPTQFVEDMGRAARAHDLWGFAARLDRLAGIGRYGVMVFVTSDVDDPTQLETEFAPTTADGDGLDKVNQIKVFGEASIESLSMGGLDSDGRWGLPEAYDIDFGSEAETETQAATPDEGEHTVHHSRTVAVPSTRRLDDDFYGRPRLEPVFNILRDIEKTMGSVAEMAYRGAEKGLAINFDPEKVNTTPGEAFLDDFDAEMQEWLHGLQFALRTAGAEVTELGGNIADVRKIFDPHLAGLASATGIPKRVFEGDPAGALASAAEDTQAYFGMIQERRQEYNTPHYVRAIARWYADNGLVAEPEGFVDATWPALRVHSEQEKAEIARLLNEAASDVMLVGELREKAGLDPDPGVPGVEPDMLVSELAPQQGPGAVLEGALAENRRVAEREARTEGRIQRGMSADANGDG